MQDYINIGRVGNKQNRQMKNKTWVTRHSKIEQKEGKRRGGVKRERERERKCIMLFNYKNKILIKMKRYKGSLKEG